MLSRLIRFYAEFNRTWAMVGGLAIFGTLSGYALAPWNSRAMQMCVNFVAFIVPYGFRHAIVERYETVINRVVRVTTVLMVAAFVLQALRLLPHGVYSLGVYAAFSFVFGLWFWATTDPMYEMRSWLAHPLEYGRPPDHISLWDTRIIRWDDDRPCRIYLFRYVYGDDVSVGVVGPFTFSIGVEDVDRKSPEDVYEEYRRWYKEPGIQALMNPPDDADDE